MANQNDIIDRLWAEVINLDPKGEWLADCLNEKNKKPSLFEQSAQALQRLTDSGTDRLDLGRVGRFLRYETCFGVFYALEDPGPKKGQLAGLHNLFEASNPSERRTWKRHEALLQSLWDSVDVHDSGEWLGNLAKKNGNGPFDDTGPAIQRLLAQGATLQDLALVGSWHRYRACVATLKMLEQSGFSDTEETAGFHELLLGADPSGKEGRPGSWPLDTAAAKRTKASRSETTAPIWHLRSGQAIGFSPDSKTLAVGGASGPVRLYDSRSGKERLVCEGLKSHIYQVAFSPDGRRIAVADIYPRLNVCDVETGRVIWKARFGDNEVSGLAYSPRSGDLLRSSWCSTIDVLDAQTGRPKEPLRPAADTHAIHAMTFLNGGNKLAAIWGSTEPGQYKQKRVDIWSWPERKPIIGFRHSGQLPRTAASVDGKILAVAMDEKGVTLYDAFSGRLLRQIGTEQIRCVAFTHKDNLLVSATDKSELCFWDIHTEQERLRIPAGTDSSMVFQLAVAPDGQFLAAATSRGVLVWNLKQFIS